MKTLLATTMLAGLVLALGCEQKQSSAPKQSAPAGGATGTPPPPVAPSAAPTTGAAAPSTGGTLSVAGVSFKVPDGWRQAPPASAMRLAELHVPDPSGDAAKECVAAFSSAGGDPAANITRWGGQVLDGAGQASAPKAEVKTIAGLKVHLVHLSGSYIGMGEAPKADWTLHGAIVEMPGQSLFIKMTGPAAQMKACSGPFAAMIDGMTKP